MTCTIRRRTVPADDAELVSSYDRTRCLCLRCYAAMLAQRRDWPQPAVAMSGERLERLLGRNEC